MPESGFEYLVLVAKGIGGVCGPARDVRLFVTVLKGLGSGTCIVMLRCMTQAHAHFNRNLNPLLA